MKRFLTTSFLLGAALILSSNVFAGQIQNLDVTPTGNQILIEWDKLTDSEMYDENGGYILQYSTVQNDIRNDKAYKNQVKSNQNTITLRAAGFERNITHFFRVYSLKIDGRSKSLNNGSKILKWMWKSNGDITSEFVAANDPVISDDSSDDLEFNFGKLRAERFDKSVHFKWSTSSLSSSDYDGFVIVLSKNDDLSSPVAEVIVPSTIITSFFEGLTPSTTYYAAGYLKKGSTRFGKSETISFVTLPEFDARQKATYERVVLKRGNLGIRYTLGGETTTTDSTSSSSTTSEGTSTTTTTSTPSTTSESKARITELKALIKKYQDELKSLEAKNTKTSSTVSSRIQALRDRLKK
jgi:hypothetical protein